MFQLYHTLNSNIQSTDLKKIEKEEIINEIQYMNQSARDAFFLLIYENSMINKDIESYNIPYGGIKSQNYVEFNLAKLPIKLRRILHKFIKILQKDRL